MMYRGTHRLSGLILVFLIAGLFSLAFVTVAQAQASGPVVTTLADDGPGSLRQAVIDAAAGDTITFAPGLTGTILVDALSGPIVVDKNLTIAGPGISKITVSGGHAQRVFQIDGGNVTISCLTIRDGNTDTGGGIRNGGNLTIEGVEFGNNAAIGGGGAIYNAPGATLTVKNGKFIANAATLGGAIFNNGTLTVKGSSFSRNQASPAGGVGGAIANADTATIAKSSLYSNTADRGGAVYSQTALTVTGSNLSGNQGFTDGGALAITGGTASISTSCIKGNNTPSFDAEQIGGALTANDNWWGKATGPNTPGADTTNVVVASFLTNPPPACQAHNHGGANPGHGDDYAIIFPASDDIGRPALHIYCVDEKGDGYLGLKVTQEMIDEYPEELEENVKVADTDTCRVYVGFYLLTTGEYQLNIGPKPNGDVAVVIFDGMPPGNVYYRDFNIFDLEWPIDVPPAEAPVLPTVTPEVTP